MTQSRGQSPGNDQLEDPHQKAPLTTPIGRLIERASYADLLAAGFGTVLLSALYFWLAPLAHSLNASSISFFDAMYFSVVTFTSLGYGDLSPKGFGRLIAATVVILGLAFIALLVGKFASERQQSILLLLHTSDCQRRLNDFIAQLTQLGLDLEASKPDMDIGAKRELLKLAAERLEVVSNYLVFNSNQARLVEFGNESSLFSLYVSLARLQKLCIFLHKSEKADLLVSRRAHAVANRCLAIVKLMLAFHRHAIMKTSYLGSFIKITTSNWMKQQPNPLSPLSLRVINLYEAMQTETNLLVRWTASAVTPIAVERVRESSPIGPLAEWPMRAHKSIASKLGISNRLAQRCIDQLIQSKRLPR